MQDTQEMRILSLSWEDLLEKGLATLSSILVQRIPWTEEPGRLQSMGHKESDMTGVTQHGNIIHTVKPMRISLSSLLVLCVCVYMLECWLVCRGLVVESKRQPEISTLISLINWAKVNLSNKKSFKKKRQNNSGEHSMHNLINVCD